MIVEKTAPETKETLNNNLKEAYLSILKEGRSVYLSARGMNMYPFIKNGDMLKVMPIKRDKIKIGDIIAVDMKDDKRAWFIAHRLIKVSKDKISYFTKGDAHSGELSAPIAREEIAGRVAQINRNDLQINLDSRGWEHLNHVIARMSLACPKTLIFISRYINLIIEWKLFLSKVKNRLKKGDPVLYNTEELLLICARRTLDKRLKKEAIDLIKEGVDWNSFYNHALRAGVTVLIYKSIVEISRYISIPKHVVDKLKYVSISIISKSGFQHTESTNIVRSLASRDVPAVPLKGTILAKRLYEDIAARGLSVDLDLLVEEKNKERARELLERNGYIFSCGEISRLRWQYDFVKAGHGRIDLHWDITMMLRSQKRIEGLWNGTRLAEKGGVRYYEFKEEELLLSLSAHLVNSSALRNLRYICDINELLSQYTKTIDWENLIKKAKEWRLSASLYAALTMSKKLFDSPVSCEILNKIKPRWPKRMFIRCFANKKFVLRDCKRKKIMTLFLSYVFFELVEAKTFSECYNIIFRRLLFPPGDAMLSSRNYTSKPVYLGYLVRIVKGFKAAIRAFCSIVEKRGWVGDRKRER